MNLAVAIEQGSGAHEGRIASAGLVFSLAGGRTVILRQHMPYPFHITRAFRLDDRRPDLSTLYLQSASGGLYRGDRLALSIEAGAGSAAHVTTQAATVVHDTRGSGAEQTTRIVTQPGSILAFTPDPLILFPGAVYRAATEVHLAEDSLVIVTEGVAWHDPAGRGRAFGSFAQSTLVRNGHGALLAADRAEIRGTDVVREGSPLGPFRAFGTLLTLWAGDRVFPGSFDAAGVCSGCVSATTRLPNGAGIAMRLLADEGGALARSLQAAFQWAVSNALGFAPAPRRK